VRFPAGGSSSADLLLRVLRADHQAGVPALVRGAAVAARSGVGQLLAGEVGRDRAEQIAARGASSNDSGTGERSGIIERVSAPFQGLPHLEEVVLPWSPENK
jgi:hypothetical protein